MGLPEDRRPPVPIPLVMRPRPHFTITVLCGVLSLSAAGCIYQRTVHSSWDQWSGDLQTQNPKWFSEGGNPQSDTQSREPKANRWAILLRSFEGHKHNERAYAFAQRLRADAEMSHVWVWDSGPQTLVYRGRFTDSSDPEATNALRQTRMVKFDGGRPFAEARLAPIVRGEFAVAGPDDLRQYAGMYTLQVEVYDKAVGLDYRKFAEERVVELRKEGAQAFYYHGPYRSSVTVGLFTHEQAFVPEIQAANFSTDKYSPAVKQLQKRFPYNLHNGRTVIESVGGKRMGEQSSSLVRIR